MRKTDRRKGIVLITTMLSVVLVVMLLSAVVYSNLGSMRMTANFYERESAAMAAESGINYALTRLENDIKWNGSTKKITDIKGSEFEVSEKDGNVIGIISLSGGRKAVFRIKFNFEDGTGGFDGLADSSDPIKSRYVSANNLLNSVPRKIYYADSDGSLSIKKEEQGGVSVYMPADEKAEYYVVPKYSCCIIAEGFCGKATQNASLDKPVDFNLPYSQMHAEAVYSVDAETLNGDYVSCASGSFKSLSNTFICANSDKSEKPWMRGFKNLDIKAGSKKLNGGMMYFGNSTNLTQKDNCFPEKDTKADTLSNIKWETVAKANDEGNSYKTVEAGTYAWCQDASGKVVLRHYKDYYPEGTSIPSAASYETLDSVEGWELRPNDYAIIISDNILIGSTVDSKGSINKNIAIRSYINKFGTKPIVGFLNEDPNSSGVIMSSDGNISIGGALLGRGSLTAVGSIDIQGPSILESDPGIGVSVYAKENVTIKGISNTTKEAERNHPTSRTDGKGPVDLSAQINASSSLDLGNAIDLSDSLAELDKKKSSAAVDNAFNEYWNSVFNDAKDFHAVFGKVCGDCQRRHADRYTCARAYSLNNTSLVVINEDYKDEIYSVVESNFKANYTGIPGGSLCGKNCGFCSPEFKHDNGRADCPLNLIIKDALEKGSQYVPDTSSSEEPSEGIGGEALTSAQEASSYISDVFVSQNSKENKEAQIQGLINLGEKLSYSDQDISGVIFAGKEVKIDVGSKSKINITGAVASYAFDDNKKALDKDKGNIYLSADQIRLISDANYTNNVLKNNVRRRFNRSFIMMY